MAFELLKAKLSKVNNSQILAGFDVLLSIDQIIDGPITGDEPATQEPRSLGSQPDAGPSNKLGCIKRELFKVISRVVLAGVFPGSVFTHQRWHLSSQLLAASSQQSRSCTLLPHTPSFSCSLALLIHMQTFQA